MAAVTYTMEKTDDLAEYLLRMAREHAEAGSEATAADYVQAALTIKHLNIFSHTRQADLLRDILEVDPADLLAHHLRVPA